MPEQPEQDRNQPSIDQSRKHELGKWQFTLRQLLFVTTAFAVLLGIGRWFWLGYQRAFVVVNVTEEDDLSLYVGRRVSLTGYHDYNHGVFYWGDQVIVCGFPLYSEKSFDRSAAQLGTIEGVLAVYDGYAREIAQRQHAKYSLENDVLSRDRFVVKVAVIAFLSVDPALIWFLRRLRRHRSWYLGVWIPITVFLIFEVVYGAFLVKTHDFPVVDHGFLTVSPQALEVLAATVCFGYLIVAFLFALPYWQWKRLSGGLVLTATTALCVTAAVLLRAWYLRG
jgi:hypothetical protein